ncbi:hypothetical protein FOL47_002749, partial [Perkinsus chesapeaki]
DGIVSHVMFDGQPLQLAIDTGLSGTYVVYKDWYERTYGKDACKQFQMGCYSCPSGCDPYAKEKHVTRFDDGSAVTSVLHEGTLSPAGKNLDMQFRLIIGFSPGSEVKALKRYCSKQLYLKKMIKKYAVSICSPSDVESFTGTLIFGDWNGLCAIKAGVTVIPMTQPHKAISLDSDLRSYGLVSPTGRRFNPEAGKRSVMYDTGSGSIFAPKSISESLLNKISYFAGPGVHVEAYNHGWNITDKGYSNFPALTFTVGSKQHFIVRIPPNKYALFCDGQWCKLAFREYGGSAVILGRPFFTTYFSSFDLELETVSIAEYKSR